MKTLILCPVCETMFATVNPLATCCSVRCRKTDWSRKRKKARREAAWGDFFQRKQNLTPFEFPLPDAPTDAPPGSTAKVEVFWERIRRKQQLWHPLDMTMDTIPDVVSLLSYGVTARKQTARHVDFLKLKAEAFQAKREAAAHG